MFLASKMQQSECISGSSSVLCTAKCLILPKYKLDARISGEVHPLTVSYYNSSNYNIACNFDSWPQNATLWNNFRAYIKDALILHEINIWLWKNILVNLNIAYRSLSDLFSIFFIVGYVQLLCPQNVYSKLLTNG